MLSNGTLCPRAATSFWRFPCGVSTTYSTLACALSCEPTVLSSESRQLPPHVATLIAFCCANARRAYGSAEAPATKTAPRSRLRRFSESLSSIRILRRTLSLSRRRRVSPALLEHAHEVAAENLAQVVFAEAALSQRRRKHGEIVDALEALRVNRVDRVVADDLRIAAAEVALEADRRLAFEEVGADADVVGADQVGDVRDV